VVSTDHVKNFSTDEIEDLVQAFKFVQDRCQNLEKERLKFVLGARLNVLAMAKKLLHIPLSTRLQKKDGVIMSVLDICAKNSGDLTALHIAASAGHVSAVSSLVKRQRVKSFLKKEAEEVLNEGLKHSGKKTVMKCAASCGKVEVVSILLDVVKEVPLLCLQGAGFVTFNASLPSAVTITALENEQLLQVTFKYGCWLRSFFNCPCNRKAYFEMVIVRVGEGSQLGFAAEFWSSLTLGDEFSWGVQGHSWKDEDIIGMACDLEHGLMFVSVNGKYENKRGIKFENLRENLFPVFTSRSAVVKFNFGGVKFKHCPPGDDFYPILSLYREVAETA